MYINLFNKLSTSTPEETKPYININNVFVFLYVLFSFRNFYILGDNMESNPSLIIFDSTLKSDSHIQIVSNGEINLIVLFDKSSCNSNILNNEAV